MIKMDYPKQLSGNQYKMISTSDNENTSTNSDLSETRQSFSQEEYFEQPQDIDRRPDD